MPRKKSPSTPAQGPTLADLRAQAQALWPVAKGSLNLVRKPCVRPSCPACLRGDKHPVWLYTFSVAGQRRCVYVPAARVPALQQALANGRALDLLLGQCGAALLRQEDGA